ncbi:zinc finger protein 862-like [Ruditapes philippinarum]|nr:zinc finger protein 862-like [Ruditapes philippinarum]
MAKLAKIALCMEISSTECERSFSTQNRLKSKLRSSLKEISLESLLRVSLYGEPVSEYDPVPDTRQWLVKNRRRKRLMQDYKPRESKKQKK